MKVKRIFLECTHTYQTNLNSGIQRVVRNIIKESEQIGKELNITCQPVIFTNGSFYPALPKKPLLIRLRAALWTFLRRQAGELRSKLRSYLMFRKIGSYLSPLITRKRIIAIINFFFDILTFPVILSMYFKHRRICAGKGDLILMLDSSWVYPIWSAVEKAKNRGALVGVVVYDLIPINHPQFCVSGLVKCFQDWYSQAVKTSDFFIAISRSTRDEVYAYVKSNQCPINYDMLEWFHLGCALDRVSEKGSVRNELEDIFKRNNYLTVGNIEPRKNHKYLLNAFDLILQQSPDTVLCIIGKIGWKCEDVVNHIKNHPLFEKNLFMFNNLSDTELDYCYRHSKALIFTSFAEGFGLPIVESLYHGLPVLASDTPIHREVGKDFCTYFDISDPSYLAKIIINIEKTGKMPEVRAPEEYNLPTWKDSCRELLSKAAALSGKVSDR